MTKRITRRQFIQMSGLTGTAVAVSGCTINLQRHETLEPYVVPPEEALPGENVWYASTCRQCQAGCGIIVRVSNGRARKIEGNPRHPLNKGKLCARGEAGLQVLYNPDRFRNAVRNEARNAPAAAADPFTTGGGLKATALPWDDVLSQVADRVKAAKPGGVAFLGTAVADSLAAIVGPFVQALGSPPPVFYDVQGAYGGRGTLARLTGQFFGTEPSLPFFDLANSDVVFSFGANLTETWLSPVAYGRAYGAMRGGALGKRGYLVQIEPRMSATAAVADEWVPAAPGTEGLIALAVGKIMIEQGLGAAKDSFYAGLFSGADVANIASLSGISEERLVKLAHTFGKFTRPTAIPGAAVAGQTNSPAAMTAILALNALAGHASDPATAFHLTPPAADPMFAMAGASTFADVQTLIASMKAGQVDVLFVYGNPRYELPVAAGFAEALRNVPFVVSFSSEVDETTLNANLILPDHTYLESWGYQVVTPPGDRPAISGQQPVVTPLYDTRATTDVFLALATRLGGPVKQALPWPNTVEFMKAAMAKLVRKSAPFDTKNADAVWGGWRQHGGYWPPTEERLPPKAAPGLPAILTVPMPEFDGGPEYPYLLYPYLSLALGAGAGASQPWLQETPDPMITGSWDTWVEINPETAKELGVKHDDVVKLTSPHGSISAIVYVYPGIRPDVLAVPLGQGHLVFGRFAQGRGANAASILAPVTTSDGELAWGATRVKVEKLNRQRVLPRIESNVGVDAANKYEKFPG